MIDKMPEHKTITIDFKKIGSFFDVFKTYMSGFYNFFRDNKNNSKIMLLIAILTSGFAIYFGVQLYNDISLLNGKSSQLNNLSSYDIRTLENDSITQTILKNSDTIKDLIQENKSIQ